LAHNLFPLEQGPTSQVVAHPATSCHIFYYNLVTLYTDNQRATANMEFLSICLLLTHYSPDFSLYHTVHQCTIPIEQNLFSREPCKHARREILSALDSSKPNLPLHLGRTYLASILSANGIDFHQTYNGNFFTQQFFSSLININNWAVSPLACPSSQFDAGSIRTLHIFDFLRAVTTIGTSPSLIPSLTSRRITLACSSSTA
jgi:hypothetical protein